MPMEYTQHDMDLAEEAWIGLDKSDIEFQFPPKVTSDSRRGSWSEGELRGTEPVAVFSTSGPREIALTWIYVVDGDKWSVERVAKNVRAIRGYFAQIRAVKDDIDTRHLAVYFHLWHIGGKMPMTCRITNIDVRHSDTIVGAGDNAYPLQTDITIDLRLWSKGDKKDKVQKIPKLRDDTPPDWY